MNRWQKSASAGSRSIETIFVKRQQQFASSMATVAKQALWQANMTPR